MPAATTTTITPVEYAAAFQGFFNSKGEEMIKEICLVEIESEEVEFHQVFRQPSISRTSWPPKYKRANIWLTNNFHGIPWCSGSTTINPDTFKLPEGIIFTKGRMFGRMLQPKTEDRSRIYDIETLGCNEKINDLVTAPSCRWHMFQTKKCARAEALGIARWVRENRWEFNI